MLIYSSITFWNFVNYICLWKYHTEEYMRGQVRNIYASSSKAKVLSLLCCHPRQGRNETVQLRSKQRSKRPHAILPSPSLKNQQQQHTETSRQPQWLSMTPSSPVSTFWPCFSLYLLSPSASGLPCRPITPACSSSNGQSSSSASSSSSWRLRA